MVQEHLIDTYTISGIFSVIYFMELTELTNKRFIGQFTIITLIYIYVLDTFSFPVCDTPPKEFDVVFDDFQKGNVPWKFQGATYNTSWRIFWRQAAKKDSISSFKQLPFATVTTSFKCNQNRTTASCYCSLGELRNCEFFEVTMELSSLHNKLRCLL